MSKTIKIKAKFPLEIKQELISEAERELIIAKQRYTKIRHTFYKIKMVQYAAGDAADDALSGEEREFLAHVLERQRQAYKEFLFWDERLERLNKYESASFDDQLKREMEKEKFSFELLSSPSSLLVSSPDEDEDSKSD